jgi:hypothetical protein
MADIQFPNQLLGPGSFTATVQDNNGAPATVLEAGEDFFIETEWRIDALSALLLGGEWEVSTYVESIGPGPEQLVGSKLVPLNGGTTYSATVKVDKNTLPNDPQPTQQSGVYKLVTVLTHRNFNKITNVAALVEGPVLRIA